ncbi:protein S100-A12-like [Sminthopsis crassicaudata]|uniref:protein S100-A12-like n=1 Tax=Sminthopsis crassicaudata TaxID=9301 RepID=UPI003D687E7E
MTDLENACETIVNIFHQYSVRTDDFDTLSFNEFKRLVKEQFPNWLGRVNDPEFITNTFQNVDKNKDKQVDFGEFVNLLIPLIKATHDHLHERDHNH